MAASWGQPDFEAEGFAEQESYFREAFEGSSGGEGDTGNAGSYEDARPAYQLGFSASRTPEYSGYRFESIEHELKTAWAAVLTAAGWDEVCAYVQAGYERGMSSATDNKPMNRTVDEGEGTLEIERFQ